MFKPSGWLKDHTDSRDFDARKLIYAEVPIPKTYRVDPTPLIYNQGNTPECVAGSACGVRTDDEWLKFKIRPWFDMDWLYQQCKMIDGVPDTPGTFPRIALQIMQAQGLKKLGLCQQPSLEFKISGYYRLDSSFTVNDMKQVLYQYGAILSASQWPDNWDSMQPTDSNGVLPTPVVTINSGGHGYKIDGWNDDLGGFYLVNDWGSQWAKKGVALVKYADFVALPLAGGDVWKVIV